MKEIPLTRGKTALVDDLDFAEIASHRWCCIGQRGSYAGRGQWVSGRIKMVYMHRAIVGAMPGEVVDHINGNRLDNQRSNLRLVSWSQNSFNRCVREGSRFIGVYHDPRATDTPWRAIVKLGGKARYLGYYKTPEAAALVRDNACREHPGWVGRFNFPQAGEFSAARNQEAAEV